MTDGLGFVGCSMGPSLVNFPPSGLGGCCCCCCCCCFCLTVNIKSDLFSSYRRYLLALHQAFVLLLHVNSVQFPFYKKSGITVLTCEVKRTVADLLCYYDVCLYNSQYQTKYFTDV